MGIHDLTYADALAKAEHLTALGMETVYIRDEVGFPWNRVSRVETGSSYRLSGPSSCYLVAEDAGLIFKLNVDFEERDANGRGVSIFDRARLRDVALKLPPVARAAFAKMLASEVLPALAARTAEIREALQLQADSEDCVRGLIAAVTEAA